MGVEAISFGAEDRVDVRVFTRQRKGDELIIGIPEARSFIALPVEAIEILDHLAAGRTVGETCSLYEEKHAETPALDDLLSALAVRGFVQRAGSGGWGSGVAASPAPVRPRFVSQRLAGMLFSTPLLAAAGGFAALVLAAVLADPGLLPGPRSIYFTQHRTSFLFFLVIWNYIAVAAHEMAHFVAARAVGVEASFGFGTRLWVLVAETDLTGLWAVTKRQRFLPLLAGTIVDVICLSLCLCVLELQRRGVLTLVPVAVTLLAALAFSYLMRLLWQCFFFVRTDLYYVIANLFDCTSLLSDTEAYLKYHAARFLPWGGRPERPHIPVSELWVVRLYAPLWITGRILAGISLVLISLPLMFRYTRDIVAALVLGDAGERADSLGVLVLSALFLGPMLWGLGLWIFGLFRKEAVR